MGDIERKLNKPMCVKNKIKSMQVFEYDFSKLEGDIGSLKEDHNNTKTQLNAVVTILAEMRDYLKHLTEQKAYEVALIKQENANKMREMQQTKEYGLIIDTLKKKRHVTTLDVISVCNISKPTALKIMRVIAMDYDGQYIFAENRGNEPARLFINKRAQEVDR